MYPEIEEKTFIQEVFGETASISLGEFIFIGFIISMIFGLVILLAPKDRPEGFDPELIYFMIFCLSVLLFFIIFR